jgi:hypothetical protein
MARIQLSDKAYITEWGTTKYQLVIGGSTCGLFRTVEDAKNAWKALQITPRQSWEIGCPAQTEASRTLM